MDRFVHIHRHDQYSVFDGMGKAEQAAKYAAELEQPALAITNHGNVCGLIDHFHKCKDAGIKPILGMEGYFVPNIEKVKDKRVSAHLILIAKNDKGYRNLMRIVSESNKHGFYYRPRLDFEMLEKYHDGLIVTSACSAGPIARLLYKGSSDSALRWIKRFKGLFKDDFYIEVQPHNLHDQKAFNMLLVNAATMLKVPIVMGSDAHFVKKEDYETHKTMRSFKGEFGGYPEAYLTSRKETLEMWKRYHGFGDPKLYMDNTLEIADKCNVELKFDGLMPSIDFGENSRKILRRLAINGLKDKGKWKQEYKDRLEHELNVIFGKGFEDYFLICWDILKWCSENGIGTNPGRGSVGGSLLAYAIDITKVDPLIHHTVFERFLRPDKTTTPDIDMDFDNRYRYKVFEYIEKRFPNRTAPIISYGLYRIKNLMNELCKMYQVEEAAKSAMIACLFSDFGDEAKEIGYKDIISNIAMRKLDKKYPGLLEHFSKLYMQVSYFGRHASGVAICGKPIKNYIGLMKSHDTFVTSYNLKEVEKLGILKMDVLGLETISTVSLVEELVNVKFDENIITDKKVIKEFQKGQTDGVFQFEKKGAKELLRQVKPRDFEQIVACNALNRPAPLQLGVADDYIDARGGNVNTKTPWYKFCKDTYGTVIYQEQVMNICRGLAEMDWPDVDKVMKTLRKLNDPDDPLLKTFVEGAVKNGIKKKDASELYDRLTQYSFNKAHATAYTMLSFYSMWLKIYYPLEFYYASLATNDDMGKMMLYQSMASGQGIIILPPHVNGSINFSIKELDGEKVIQVGLIAIKGIGKKVADEIISNGPFNCVELVEDRVEKRFFNSRVRTVLEEAGALEFDESKWSDRVARYNARLLNDYRRRVSRE
jgi:DNA polymerase-3 subunit alpha